MLKIWAGWQQLLSWINLKIRAMTRVTKSISLDHCWNWIKPKWAGRTWRTCTRSCSPFASAMSASGAISPGPSSKLSSGIPVGWSHQGNPQNDAVHRNVKTFPVSVLVCSWSTGAGACQTWRQILTATSTGLGEMTSQHLTSVVIWLEEWAATWISSQLGAKHQFLNFTWIVLLF